MLVEGFRNMIHYFIDRIVNDRPIAPLGATFYDGLKCQEVMETVLESTEKGKWISVPEYEYISLIFS